MLKIAVKGSFLGLRPGQVTGVQVDRITHNSVRVRWTKPAEASARPITSFGIYTRTRNAADTGWDGWTWRHNPGASATSHTVTGLPSEARQQVRVFARAEQSGQTTLYGADSDHVEFTTAAANLPGAPAAPTVSATADSHTSLDVSWSAPTNTGPAITGYDLRYRAGTSGSFTAGPQGVTGTSTTIGSLQAGTSYQVQVRATNAVGDSAWSPSGTGATTVGHTAPAAPATPRVSRITETGARIVWSDPADTGTTAVDDYDVQVRRAGTSAWGTSVPAVVGTLDPARLTLTGYDPDGSGPQRAVGLTSGIRYEVRVRANNRQGTTVHRGAWSPAASFTTRGTPDTTAPSLVSAAVNGRTLVLTYDEALDPNSVPRGAALRVSLGGSLVSLRSVTIRGRTVTLTLSVAANHGETETVSYVVPATNPIRDLAGNAAAALTNQAVTNNTPAPDTTAPSLVSAAVNGAALVLTYDEALDPSSVPGGAALRVSLGGSLVSLRSVTIRGRTVTLTLSVAANHGETVTVSYVVPATNPIRDLAGNDAAAFTNQAVTNNTPAPDTTAPSLVSAAVNGAALVLTYDEALDPNSVPAASSFWTVVAGTPTTLSTVAVSGRKVTLTLSSQAAAHGETVTVSYTAPTANPIQDLAGNAAAALTNQAVTNNTPHPDTTAPSLVSAAVNGAALVLTYDEALDPNSVPAASSFWTVVAGTPTTLSTVAVSGRKVTLTLSSQAAAHGETVTVSYTAPTANPIQDLAGNAAVALTNQAVTNNTPAPDTTTPSLVSAAVNGRRWC